MDVRSGLIGLTKQPVCQLYHKTKENENERKKKLLVLWKMKGSRDRSTSYQIHEEPRAFLKSLIIHCVQYKTPSFSLIERLVAGDVSELVSHTNWC